MAKGRSDLSITNRIKVVADEKKCFIRHKTSKMWVVNVDHRMDSGQSFESNKHMRSERDFAN